MDLAQQNVTCLLTHFLILMREIPGKTTLVSPLKILSLKPQKMVVSKLCNLWVQLLKQIHKYYIYIYIYIYIRLKIKPNSVRIRFQSCQIFLLPSTGFEPTPLLHCSTIRLVLRPAPQTTRLHPLPYIYIYIYV